MEKEFGPELLKSGSGDRSGGGGEDHDTGGSGGSGGNDAMRSTAASYARWMEHHVNLKSRYPEEFRNKPTLDWEMRDPWDWHTTDPIAAADDTSELDSDDRRRKVRRLSQQSDLPLHSDSVRGYPLEDIAEEVRQRSQQQRRQRLEEREVWWRGDEEGEEREEARRRQLLWRRKKPVAQGYVDGTAWLSAALGRPLQGLEDPERLALQLPYPFCARHDNRWGQVDKTVGARVFPMKKGMGRYGMP